MFYFSIGLAILSSLLYHVFQKLTPVNVNFALTLTVTYATATAVCLVMLGFYRTEASFADSLRKLNWASFALAFALVGLEVGFLLVYRSGWNISLAALVSNTAVAILLIPVGLTFFKERLSPVNIIGLVVCGVGLVMVNIRQ
jgi:uncharacterized membrane protein